MASQEDVERARREAKIAEIQRNETVEAWETYSRFWAKNIFGTAFSITGGLEILTPEVITATIPEPHIVLGVGIATLTGKNVIRRIAKIFEALNDEENRDAT